MKNRLLAFFLMISFSSVAFAEQCNYDQIKGQDYKVLDKHARFVKNDFDAYPDKESYQQGTLNDYASLINNNFKVTSTNHVTKASSYYEPINRPYKFKDIVVGGKAYLVDSLYNVEVTTSDCQKFYFDPSYTDLESLKTKIGRSDNADITEKNYFDFMGDSIKKSSIGTTSQYDKFEKKTLVKTDYFKQYLIRGSFDQDKNRFSAIQIYLDTVTFTKGIGGSADKSWNNIRVAKDTDGNSHDVIQIAHNVDCSGSKTLGCTLKETLGIDVSEQFLRKHRNGFELKLVGSNSFVTEIHADVIQSFLKEADRLKALK